MILRIQRAEVKGPSQLWLQFNDGAEGLADIKPLLQGPVFEPLREPTYFASMELDKVCGTVVWPNGADFAPEALRALIAFPATNSAAPDRRVSEGIPR
jgi:hypothetical protein